MEMRRRGFLLGVAAGACVTLGEDVAAKAPMRAAVSPPGTDLARLRARCTGCNLCVAKCPTKVLKAATFEYGLGGTMMPTMDFMRGYCEKDCTRCGEVCPTGAIRWLAKEEKAKTKIGQVVLASGWKGLCLAHKENHPCGLCEKHCPTGAIKVVDAKNDGQDGRRPTIAAENCIGCGACAHVCPAAVLSIDPERS